MDFSLSTDHEILRESVRSFAEKEIKPVARELDEKEEFSYETMQKMAQLGLFGIYPEYDRIGALPMYTGLVGIVPCLGQMDHGPVTGLQTGLQDIIHIVRDSGEVQPLRDIVSWEAHT